MMAAFLSLMTIIATERLANANASSACRMCQPGGTATTPAPRTIPRPELCKSRCRKHHEMTSLKWHKWHEQLAREATQYNASGSRALFLGDSLFEFWRGTTYGIAEPATHEYPPLRMAADVFGPPLFTAPPIIQAISSDATQHLLWRLDHGELPPRMASDRQLTIALLIGTNNLQNSGWQQTCTAVAAVARQIVQRTASAAILVLGLLPRADEDGPRWRVYACPSCLSACCLGGLSIMSDVRRVNECVQVQVAALAAEVAPARRVGFIDCGSGLANAEQGRLHRDLRQDAVHPNARGYAVLAACVKSALVELLGPRAPLLKT